MGFCDFSATSAVSADYGMCTAASAPEAASSPIERVHVRVIAFNDFHGRLESRGIDLALPDPQQPGRTLKVAVGGASALAGTVRALREGSPYSVVVSGGDMVGAAPPISTLFRHESTIEAMNALGLDIGTVGNHEFDAGVIELARLKAGGCAVNARHSAVQSCALHGFGGAQFTLLSSNVEKADGQPFFPSSTVRQYGPVKVGFIGAVTRTTEHKVIPSGIAGVQFGDEADAINRAAEQLQTQGVHTIVVTIHEGAEIGTPDEPADWNDERCPQLRGDILPISQRLSPHVDVLLTAHTHAGYRCNVDGRPMIQAFSYGRGVSVVDLTIDPNSGRVDKTQTATRNLPVFNERSDPVVRDALLAQMPAPYANALRKVAPAGDVAQTVAAYSEAVAPLAQRKVGRIGAAFNRNGMSESPAGRLIADAQLAATRGLFSGRAQIALMHPGGIRNDLRCEAAAAPCDVSFGDAFTMQPFGNTLVVMTLTGAELQAVLESQQPQGQSEPMMLSPSAGFTYRWNASAAAGSRAQNLQLNGTAIKLKANYRVTVNSFLAEGGDGFVGFKAGRHRTGGASELDALLAALKRGPSPDSKPRVAIVP